MSQAPQLRVEAWAVRWVRQTAGSVIGAQAELRRADAQRRFVAANGPKLSSRFA
jgi:hypothetical protein